VIFVIDSRSPSGYSRACGFASGFHLMKYLDEYRDHRIARASAAEIAQSVTCPWETKVTFSYKTK
jgi:hypothetical protein